MEGQKVVIVFAKAPRAGQVKTRLAAGLGEPGALRVYRQMAEGIWKEMQKGQERGDFSLWLCFDPPEAEPEMRTWLEGADRYLPQVPGNLGRRLASALATAFSAGYREASVIGTDTPSTTQEHILEAFRNLETQRVVFGPSVDGGFYLMALTPPRLDLWDLLEEVPWSSPDTLAALIGGARCLGLGVHLLPEARDIDTVEDFEAHYGKAQPPFAGR